MRSIPWLMSLLILAATAPSGCRKKAPETPVGQASRQGTGPAQPAEARASRPLFPGGEAASLSSSPTAAKPRTGAEGRPYRIPGVHTSRSSNLSCASGVPARTVRTLQTLSEIQRSWPKTVNKHPAPPKSPEPKTLASPSTPVAPN